MGLEFFFYHNRLVFHPVFQKFFCQSWKSFHILHKRPKTRRGKKESKPRKLLTCMSQFYLRVLLCQKSFFFFLHCPTGKPSQCSHWRPLCNQLTINTLVYLISKKGLGCGSRGYRGNAKLPWYWPIAKRKQNLGTMTLSRQLTRIISRDTTETPADTIDPIVTLSPRLPTPPCPFRSPESPREVNFAQA